MKANVCVCVCECDVFWFHLVCKYIGLSLCLSGLLCMHTLEYLSIWLINHPHTHTYVQSTHTHFNSLHTHTEKDASSPTNKSSCNAHPRLRSTRYPSSPPYAFLPAMSIECVWRTHHRTEIECLKGTFKLKEMFEHRRPALTKLTGGVPFNIDPLFSHKRVKHWTRN